MADETISFSATAFVVLISASSADCIVGELYKRKYAVSATSTDWPVYYDEAKFGAILGINLTKNFSKKDANLETVLKEIDEALNALKVMYCARIVIDIGTGCVWNMGNIPAKLPTPKPRPDHLKLLKLDTPDKEVPDDK